MKDTVNYFIICNDAQYLISGHKVDRIMDRVAVALDNCRKYWRFNDVFLLQFIKQLTSDENIEWSMYSLNSFDVLPSATHKIPVINMDTLCVDLYDNRINSMRKFNGITLSTSSIFEMTFDSFIDKFKKEKSDHNNPSCAQKTMATGEVRFNDKECGFSKRLEEIERKLGIR